VLSIQGVVTAPKAPSSYHSPSASASLAPDSRHSKLAAASKDDLVRLIERLAADSAEVSARLDYLTDPDAAAKALQGRIRSVRSNKRFVSYSEAREVAAELGFIAADIRADVLPKDSLKAAALAEKLFSLDDVIFHRADDSDGLIGDQLRAACVLWLDAMAAARKVNAGAHADWAAALYDLYQALGVQNPRPKAAIAGSPRAPFRTRKARGYRPAPGRAEAGSKPNRTHKKRLRWYLLRCPQANFQQGYRMNSLVRRGLLSVPPS
jgi:hypothetical protein